MAESRFNYAYEKPDYIINDGDYEHLEQAKKRLIDICNNYIKTDPGIFGKAQELPAQHVIKELNFLDSRNKYIPAADAFSFKQVVLQSYLIALQEYLPKQSKLYTSVIQLINDFFPNQNFDNIKQSYREEIDQIKQYFSSFIFRQCAYEYNLVGGISVFYKAYLKLHPEMQHVHPEEGIDLKTMTP